MTGKAGTAGGQTDWSGGGQAQPSGEAAGSRGGRSMRADSDECGDGKRGMGRGQAETEACHDIDNPTAHELQPAG